MGTKICLSITGFHPEFWQPAWGIRTVLLAISSLMPIDEPNAVGSLIYSSKERKLLAKRSLSFVCPQCGNISKTADNPSIQKRNMFSIAFKLILVSVAILIVAIKVQGFNEE